MKVLSYNSPTRNSINKILILTPFKAFNNIEAVNLNESVSTFYINSKITSFNYCQFSHF